MDVKKTRWQYKKRDRLHPHKQEKYLHGRIRIKQICYWQRPPDSKNHLSNNPPKEK